MPIGLYPAAKSVDIDFDWLDRRSMKPVGYKRMNKETGKEVPREDIVRGFQYEDNRYVVMSDEEIRAANVKAMHSVDIFAFVDPVEIPPVYLDTPYYLDYLALIQCGEKVYALLWEILRQTKKSALPTSLSAQEKSRCKRLTIRRRNGNGIGFLTSCSFRALDHAEAAVRFHVHTLHGSQRPYALGSHFCE